MHDVDEEGDDRVTVAMADLERAAELADVEPPEDPDDQEAVVDYLTSMTGFRPGDESPPAVAALLPEASQYERAGAQLGEFEDDVGWSVLDVSWFVEYQLPPGVFTVMGGDFDEGRLSDAMGQPEDEIWRLGEEDFGRDMEAVSAARPIGESLRLALDDDRLLVGRATPPVEDALAGDGETLADDPVLRSLAEALDDEDAYSALLVAGRSFGIENAMGDRPLTPEVVARIEEWGEVLPEPFEGVAVGLTYEDDQAVAVFAYAHDDQAPAEANAEALRDMIEEGESLTSREPWSNWFSIDDIRVDGTTIVARLAMSSDRPATTAYQVLQEMDSLVIHR